MMSYCWLRSQRDILVEELCQDVAQVVGFWIAKTIVRAVNLFAQVPKDLKRRQKRRLQHYAARNIQHFIHYRW